jgi:hypothetical protein
MCVCACVQGLSVCVICTVRVCCVMRVCACVQGLSVCVICTVRVCCGWGFPLILPPPVVTPSSLFPSVVCESRCHLACDRRSGAMCTACCQSIRYHRQPYTGWRTCHVGHDIRTLMTLPQTPCHTLRVRVCALHGVTQGRKECPGRRLHACCTQRARGCVWGPQVVPHAATHSPPYPI